MMRLLKWTVFILIVAGAGFGFYRVTQNDQGEEPAFTLVPAEIGTVVDKALATGQIVPVLEVQVKSQISGIVSETFVKVGDRVEPGAKLFTINPDPTPLALTEAERNMELAAVALKKAESQYERTRVLHEGGLLSLGELETSEENFNGNRIRWELEKERLALLREGKILKAKGGVDSVIRATTAGIVLERLVDPGDPVVPLTTFQAGTPLLTLADMSELIFKGTVDEIDVGKLSEGQPVRFQIGALPTAEVNGKLSLIAPKAKEEEGATLFDVEAEIGESEGVTLRAGYSANADIIIQEKVDVVIIPERLLIFEDDSTFVEIAADPTAEPEKRAVELGLSDGLNVEIVDGVAEGDQIVQRPPKEITGRS